MKKNKKQAGLTKASLSASLEDYLEAIYNLTKQSGKAHSKDIAKSLGVTMPSVTGALRLLKAKKLANHTPYGVVALTAAGSKTAAEVTRKHDVLSAFFADVLGLKQDIAQKTACRAEHTLGDEAVAKLIFFMEFTAAESAKNSDIASKFEKYCRRTNRKS